MDKFFCVLLLLLRFLACALDGSQTPEWRGKVGSGNNFFFASTKEWNPLRRKFKTESKVIHSLNAGPKEVFIPWFRIMQRQFISTYFFLHGISERECDKLNFILKKQCISMSTSNCWLLCAEEQSIVSKEALDLATRHLRISQYCVLCLRGMSLQKNRSTMVRLLALHDDFPETRTCFEIDRTPRIQECKSCSSTTNFVPALFCKGFLACVLKGLLRHQHAKRATICHFVLCGPTRRCPVLSAPSCCPSMHPCTLLNAP